MAIFTDEELTTIICSCSDGYAPPDRFDVARAIEAAVIERIKSRGAVAYRHLMDDGYEYYDAPTGEDCSGCEALYRIED